jgi:shikimate dehydrogenase
MHNHVLKCLGIEGAYVPFQVGEGLLADAFRGIRALGIRGVNVTIPHKESVVPHLDGLVGTAGILGVVNTVVNDHGSLFGHNTDVEGFSRSMEGGGIHIRGLRALVVGTGGAAKAVLFSLRSMGAQELLVTGRDPSRVRRAASRAGATSVPWDAWIGMCSSVDLLVNATSVSTPREDPELASLLEHLKMPEGGHVVDINYNRSPNIWQRAARKMGCRFMDGISMLVHQARASFSIWTGRQVDVDLFWEALR